MWIALNNAFLSVVKPTAAQIPASERKLAGHSDLLMVRARKKEHLEAVFPGRRIYNWKARDYPVRVFVDRHQLAAVVAAQVTAIDYGNFKDSVADDELHEAYAAVWSAMHRYQYGGFRAGAAWGLSPEEETTPEWLTDPRWTLPDSEVCGLIGCTPDAPCLDCLTTALAACNKEALGAEPDRYGDYDEDADADALSLLRVAPRRD